MEALEQEKAQLRGMASATRKSDKRRIPGHGTALEVDDRIVQLKPGQVSLVKDMDSVRVIPTEKSMAALDPEVLGALAREAKDLEAEARDSKDAYESAQAAATNARVRLNDYMREHGL